MDLVVFENNKPYVIDEFREGRFDYLELASDVAETKFFQFLFGQGSSRNWPAITPRPADAIMCRWGCTSPANCRCGCTVRTAFTVTR